MKLDYIKENKKIISVVLSGMAVLFAVLIVIKITSYFKLSARAGNVGNAIRTIIAKDNNRQEELNKCLSPTKEMAESLKKKNLFVPSQEKKNPVTEVRCILGDEVFINNKWCKEGEMVQDAKIVRLEPTQVTIEWEGKTTVFGPLDAPGSPAGPGERPPSGPGPGSPQPPSPGAAPMPPSLRGLPPGLVIK